MLIGRTLEVIKGTEAEVVKLTHGNGDVLARYLQEMGINASVLNESFYVRRKSHEIIFTAVS